MGVGVTNQGTIMTMFAARLRAWAVAGTALVALFATTSAAAEDRRVRIINETNHTIVRFYGSNAGTTSWEEDILGDDVLRPGQSVVINFDDGTGYCKFDFKAEFDDGDEVIKNGVDVCEISSFRFTD
jgi:NADPH-dependent 2,4-dienoyl-CoA reductase/sulfur reductase-like enzyme